VRLQAFARISVSPMTAYTSILSATIGCELDLQNDKPHDEILLCTAAADSMSLSPERILYTLELALRRVLCEEAHR
jgi:hypothetical protein